MHRRLRRAISEILLPGEKPLARTRCLPSSGIRGVREGPFEGPIDLPLSPEPGALFQNPLEDAATRQRMAVVMSTQRLLFLAVSMLTGGEWASLRTFPLGYVVGVRALSFPEPQGSRRGVGRFAEIVFADDVVFVLRFSSSQARSACVFVDALGATTSIIDRELPI